MFGESQPRRLEALPCHNAVVICDLPACSVSYRTMAFSFRLHATLNLVTLVGSNRKRFLPPFGHILANLLDSPHLSIPSAEPPHAREGLMVTSAQNDDRPSLLLVRGGEYADAYKRSLGREESRATILLVYSLLNTKFKQMCHCPLQVDVHVPPRANGEHTRCSASCGV